MRVLIETGQDDWISLAAFREKVRQMGGFREQYEYEVFIEDRAGKRSSVRVQAFDVLEAMRQVCTMDKELCPNPFVQLEQVPRYERLIVDVKALPSDRMKVMALLDEYCRGRRADRAADEVRPA